MYYELDNKVILVTGASRGLGRDMGELEIIQRLVAGILDNKIVVDTNTRINSENDKISIFDLSKKK